MTSKYVMFYLKENSNQKDFLQNENLEIIPIDIVVQFFTHENVVCIHLCNECKRSNALDRTCKFVD